MASSFSDIISKLHSTVAESANNLDENGKVKNALIINNKRQISATEDFDTVIAYEGDINSQIITIQCPRYHDEHDLSACGHKELKWKNDGGGTEGVSTLKTISSGIDETIFYMQWEVPADTCAKSGNVKISISIYDKNGDYTVFSWNTAEYTALSIGQTMNSVSSNFPAKDEILVIDEDTKNIVAPSGYNNTICTYGDIGVSEVYFLVNRYLGKNNDINVLNSTTSIYIIINGRRGVCTSENESLVVKQLYTEEIDDRNNEGLVLIRWKVPNGITAGNNGPGTFSIMLGFEQGGKRWFSNVYQHLNIGESLVQIEPGESEEWGVLEDAVKSIIDEYFINNNFIIG